MTVPTAYPALNATRISDVYAALNTSTPNGTGGALLLLATFLIAFSALGNETVERRVLTGSVLTFLVSLFGILVGLTTWTETGVCLAVTFVTVAAIQLRAPTYG